MCKLIRSIAPIVLVLFLSTNVFATIGYQDVQYSHDIKYSVGYWGVGFLSDFTYKPKTNDKFTVNIKAFYKDTLFRNIKLTKADGLSYSNSDFQNGDYVFYLKAPSMPGTYLCTFEGMASNGEIYTFDVPINVESQNKISFLEQTERIIGPVGTIIGILLMVGIVYAVATQNNT
jgi:hypothetical protein